MRARLVGVLLLAGLTILPYARMDAPGELIMGNGLPAGYDPRTFKVDFPQ